MARLTPPGGLLPLVVRLYATPATHRLLPAAVALPLVAALDPGSAAGATRPRGRTPSA